MQNRHKNSAPSGFALIAVVLILGIVILVGGALYALTTHENRIARSHEPTLETYYLAEAGINDVIYTLQNDAVWEQEFEEGTLDRSLNQSGGIIANGSYEVSAVSVDVGEAEIVALGKIEKNGTVTQRIIKTKVIKATNPSPLAGATIYAGTFLWEDADSVVSNGNIFVNNDIVLNGDFIVHGDLAVRGSVQIQGQGDLSVDGSCAIQAGECPPECTSCVDPPDPIDLPMVDFDSDDPNSYKNQADVVYSEAQFADLLATNKPLVLDNMITYVEGNVSVGCDQRLELSGLLVADGYIEVCSGKKKDEVALEITHITGQPSGLMSKGAIQFKNFPQEGTISIAGILYSSTEIEIKDLTHSGSLEITGSIFSETVSLRGSKGQINITYDDDIFLESFLGPPTFSPTLTTEHWEEQY